MGQQRRERRSRQHGRCAGPLAWSARRHAWRTRGSAVWSRASLTSPCRSRAHRRSGSVASRHCRMMPSWPAAFPGPATPAVAGRKAPASTSPARHTPVDGLGPWGSSGDRSAARQVEPVDHCAPKYGCFHPSGPRGRYDVARGPLSSAASGTFIRVKPARGARLAGPRAKPRERFPAPVSAQQAPSLPIWPMLAQSLRGQSARIVHLCLASVLIHLLGLALPLFSMAVFDRVIPHAAFENTLGARNRGDARARYRVWPAQCAPSSCSTRWGFSAGFGC